MPVSLPPEHLSKWVARMMGDLTEEGPICRFELMHTVDDGAERLAVERIKPNESDAGDITQILFDAAEHDASTRSSSEQRYTILAFRGEEQRDHEAAYPFRVRNSRNQFTGSDSDSPTEKGERAQMLRHNNENHALMLRFAESMGGRLATELDRETRRRQAAEDEVRKRSLELEDLRDRQLDRELRRAGEVQNQKYIADIVGGLIPLVPLIVGGIAEKYLSGKEEKNGHEAKALVPHNPEKASRETVLRELFAHLTQGEAEAAFNALSPMHRIVLGQLFSTLKGAATDMQKASVDSSMHAFMKGLTPPEIMGVMAGLEQGNRNRFLLLYQSYGKEEEKRQEDSPELLKDQPPPPTEEARAD